MAKTFTKIGKEITIAVKNGGPDVTGNPRLRALLQTARSENMPKENIERAIKKATDKDQADYKEVVYEGYGPHGVAILVETATDNTNRTVANVRSYFNKFGGSLGTSGSVAFMFDHKCVFKIKNSPDIDIEELELELIDFGAEEVFVDEFENKDGDTEEVINIYGDFTAFNSIQKFIAVMKLFFRIIGTSSDIQRANCLEIIQRIFRIDPIHRPQDEIIHSVFP